MEIMEKVGTDFKRLYPRIFLHSSNEDQKLFQKGGLTFGYNGVQYGSCDALWFIDNQEFIDPYNQKEINEFPVVALEGTDALARGSSGNAQLQRFHHALGAIKAGVIGIYYLKPGKDSVRHDLYIMAYNASKIEKGYYIITQNLSEVKNILVYIDDYGYNSSELKQYLNLLLDNMLLKYKAHFEERYNGSLTTFANKRSTLVFDEYIIKHAGRMLRNFTESSQRAGHIAVGEMYFSKYMFPDKHLYYLFPKMTREDIEYLDLTKIYDKEWSLLRNEENVTIITIDDLKGLDYLIKNELKKIKDDPLKGDTLRAYNCSVGKIVEGLRSGTIIIEKN